MVAGLLLFGSVIGWWVGWLAGSATPSRRAVAAGGIGLVAAGAVAAAITGPDHLPLFGVGAVIGATARLALPSVVTVGRRLERTR